MGMEQRKRNQGVWGVCRDQSLKDCKNQFPEIGHWRSMSTEHSVELMYKDYCLNIGF